jgi:putative Mg2+ transporter-C (MgtC) family protein
MNGEGGTMLSTHVEIMESLGRLGVALALGSVIGFERQWRQKIAGLRTNALVALGSCGFVVFSAMVGEGDPTRVAAQVVTGIGFLCAGTILREGINVHGLNTAATLWCCAMVGTFAGAGFWAPSLVATGFVVGTNLLLRPPVRLINTENLSTAHDLKHTFGRRLRAAGVSFEDRQDLLGHRSGRITTHYSQAELTSLIEAAEKVCSTESRKSPATTWLRRKTG